MIRILRSRKNTTLEIGRILIAVALVGGYLHIAAAPAYAKKTQAPPADGYAQGLEVFPSKVEMIVQPGEEATVSIECVNNSDVKMQLSYLVWDFARDERGTAVPIAKDDSSRFRGAANWLTLSKKLPALPANSSRKIDVVINVPNGIESGTHYTYLRLKGTPEKPKIPGGVTVRYALDVLFLPMVVKKTHAEQPVLQTKAHMAGFEPKNMLNTGVPIPFTAKIRNDGNVHLNFEGVLEVWQGKTKLRSMPVKRTLLPDTVAGFELGMEDIPYFGRYKAVFKGEAFLSKTHEKIALSGKTRFWYVPLNLIYAALGLLSVVLVLSGWLLRQWLRARKVDLAADPVEINLPVSRY